MNRSVQAVKRPRWMGGFRWYLVVDGEVGSRITWAEASAINRRGES